MKKCIFSLIVMAFMAMKMHAQGIDVARSICEDIRLYMLTDNPEYRDSINSLCSQKVGTRIANALALMLAPRYNYPTTIASYKLDTYLNIIEHASRDSIRVEFCDFERVDDNLILAADSHRPSGAEYITCRVKVSGPLNFETKDLIIIREGKITLITQYRNSN